MKFPVEDGTKLAITRALNILYLTGDSATGHFLYRTLRHFLADPAKFAKFHSTAPQTVVLAEFHSQFLREFGIGDMALWRESSSYDYRLAIEQMHEPMSFWERSISILEIWNRRVGFCV